MFCQLPLFVLIPRRRHLAILRNIGYLEHRHLAGPAHPFGQILSGSGNLHRGLRVRKRLEVSALRLIFALYVLDLAFVLYWMFGGLHLLVYAVPVGESCSDLLYFIVFSAQIFKCNRCLFRLNVTFKLRVKHSDFIYYRLLPRTNPCLSSF